MAKTGQDDTFYCNNPRTLEYTVEDQNAGDGSALDLTGLTAKWAMARLKSDGSYGQTAILEKSIGSGITVINAAAGRLDVALTAANTASLKPGRYHHQLELFDGSGNGIVAATGTLTLLRNLTNT